jgi:hypothetical protein
MSDTFRLITLDWLNEAVAVAVPPPLRQQVLAGAGTVRAVRTGYVSVSVAGNLALNVAEQLLKLAAQHCDGNDDDNGDEGNHNAVFDGRCTLFFAVKASGEAGVKSKHFELLSE